MAKPRRKKRTSIRTAAGTVQDQFIARMKELRADPLRTLPDCPQGDPKSIARIRKKVQSMAAKGKGGLFDKRDKGIVGAVAHALPFAELTAVPRIADHRVAGKRRFFLQRGHVSRACSIGVQNFDDPLALLVAYRDMAKSDGLHFFASPGFWCSGSTPIPPADWLDDLTTVALKPEATDRFGCGHTDENRVLLGFRGGPALAICAACAKADKNIHGRIAQRYAGPRQRQPVDVQRLTKDGTVEELPSESVAAYRAGILTEAKLLKSR